MSEIDKLLISVGIDEGSNLDELYQMLKQLETTGKIELEIPDMITQRQFARLGTRITNLSNKLKPLISKFPEIEESIRTMFKEIVVQKIDEILKIVEKSLKEGFGKDIKSILKSIEEQTIREPVLEILEIVRKIRGQFQTFQARLAMQMRREFDKIDINGQIDALEENLKGFLNIEDLYDDISLTNENIIELKNRINNVLGIIEGFSENLEEFKIDSPTMKKIELATRRTLELTNMIQNSLWEVGQLHGDFVGMKTDVMKQFEEFLSDYYVTTLDLKQMRIEISRITSDRTETRRTIETHMNKALKEKFTMFKDKLDDNLKGIIIPELDTFLDAVAAVFPGEEKGFESIWKAPGVKGPGHPKYMELSSGLFRELVAKMTTISSKNLTTMTKLMQSRGVTRHIEGMAQEELDRLGQFFGFSVKKKRGPEQAFRVLNVILNKIHKDGIDTLDIVGGTKIKIDGMTKENIPQENIIKDQQKKIFQKG